MSAMFLAYLLLWMNMFLCSSYIMYGFKTAHPIQWEKNDPNNLIPEQWDGAPLGLSASPIVVTLFWDDIHYRCVINASEYNTTYLCNTSNEITTTKCQIKRDTDDIKYGLQIDNHYDNVLLIDRVIIQTSYDSYNFRYFCTQLQFPPLEKAIIDTVIIDNHCLHSNYTAYDVIMVTNFDSKFAYVFIPLITNEEIHSNEVDVTYVDSWHECLPKDLRESLHIIDDIGWLNALNCTESSSEIFQYDEMVSGQTMFINLARFAISIKIVANTNKSDNINYIQSKTCSHPIWNLNNGYQLPSHFKYNFSRHDWIGDNVSKSEIWATETSPDCFSGTDTHSLWNNLYYMEECNEFGLEISFINNICKWNLVQNESVYNHIQIYLGFNPNLTFFCGDVSDDTKSSNENRIVVTYMIIFIGVVSFVIIGTIVYCCCMNKVKERIMVRSLNSVESLRESLIDVDDKCAWDDAEYVLGK